jgi:hypothetical protein
MREEVLAAEPCFFDGEGQAQTYSTILSHGSLFAFANIVLDLWLLSRREIGMIVAVHKLPPSL